MVFNLRNGTVVNELTVYADLLLVVIVHFLDVSKYEGSKHVSVFAFKNPSSGCRSANQL